MSLLPCITFANPNVELYGQGGGGGGGGSNGPVLAVSTIYIQDREIWGASNAADLQWVRNASGEPVSSITLYNACNVPIAQFNQGGFQANNINVNNQLATPVINFENIGQTQVVAQIQADSNTGDALTLNGVLNPIVQVSRFNGPLDLTTFAQFNPVAAEFTLHDTTNPVSTIFFRANPSTITAANFGVSSLTASTITVDTLLATSTFTSSIYNTYYFSSSAVFTSSVTCSAVNLDNQQLTASPTNLLLNGVPIATLSNISSIADWAQYPAISTINVAGNDIQAVTNLSSQSIYTSSINGHEFTEQGVTISSINSVQLSSIIGNVAFSLVSTLQFSPNINPSLGGVNLGLGSILGNVIGWGAGALGAVTGTAALGTGIAALAMGRGNTNVNTNNFEMINGTSQLQVSTIGDYVSSIYRESTGSPADQVPGNEVFTSTIFAPGTTLMRTYSDPMYTMSTPQSTIQAFGPWVELPGVALVSSFVNLYTQNLEASTITMPLAGTISGQDLPGSGTTLSGFYELAARRVGTDILATTYNTEIEVLNSLNVSTASVYASTFVLSPSTILKGDLTGASLEVLEAQDPTKYGQLLAQSLELATDTNFTGGSGSLYFQSTTNRPGFIDSNVAVHTLAYYSDVYPTLSNNDVDTVTVNLPGTIGALNLSVFSDGASPDGARVRFYTDVAKTSSIVLTYEQSYAYPSGAGEKRLSLEALNQPADLALWGGVYFADFNDPGIGSKASFINGDSNANMFLQASNVHISSLQVSTINNAPYTAILPDSALNISSITLSSINVNRVDANIITATTGLISSLFFDGAAGSSALATNITNVNQVQSRTVSTLQSQVSSLTFAGTSGVQFATINTTGTQNQPAGRLRLTGNALDLGSNDLWCDQIRCGAGAGVGQAEIVMYNPGGQAAHFSLENGDAALRTSNYTVAAQGYLLDTRVNPPFFSTIVTSGTPQTRLMSFFPSTQQSTIGISTISVMPQLSYYCSALASTTQTVIAANTPTNLDHTHTAVNIGGFTVLGSTITVPVAGTYEIGTSIQFDKSGGGIGIADFWFRKNGTDIEDSGSQIVVNGTNGETIGTVSILDTAVANDQYTICFASDDATMAATFFQSTVTTPYTRPAIPSIITNIKRIGQ